MAKCNTQANDMATTANNWRTPGATKPGRYMCRYQNPRKLLKLLWNLNGFKLCKKNFNSSS